MPGGLPSNGCSLSVNFPMTEIAYFPSGNNESLYNGYIISGNLPPTENGYLSSGNNRSIDNGYILDANLPPSDIVYVHSGNHQPQSNDLFFTGNGYFNSSYPQSASNSYQYQSGSSNYNKYNIDSLDFEFNRLGLSSSPLTGIRDLQRMRAQSTGLNYAKRKPNRLGYLDTDGTGTSSPSCLTSDLRGKIVIAAKDQSGCRYLQNKLGNLEDVQLIFSELKDHICELMVDQFGNYLVQKFFNVVNEDQMNQLLCLLLQDERKFKQICTDMHGTRAVQKLLERLTTHNQRSLVVSVLRRITLSLIKNHNGQHVIQHCLKYFPYEDNKDILNVVAENCLDVATDQCGCIVIQQCLTHSVGEPLDHLIAKIISNALILSEHPYGNYVVQYILGFRIPQVTSDIIVQLSGHFVALSLNKYGSNVVEECLKQSQGGQALPIIEELIRSPNSLRVLQDPYGNYVAQSALTVSNNEFMGAANHALVRLVNLNYPFLHSHPHGKRVLALARTKGFKPPRRP